MDYIKKVLKYFSKHPAYTATIHMLGGLGLGILIARPFVMHPVRLGFSLIAIALLGHLWPYFTK